jgi:catechol 2,3-dioxygenase-like lactoylglutathione lyase family enzyme
MKIEHIAFNVPEPAAMAIWYQTWLGFQLKRALNDAAQTHFLADDTGEMMIEIYCNDSARVPCYAEQHPLELHLALVTADPETDRQRLCAAGARYVEEVRFANGSHLVMLRDPWGLPLQLCKRVA